MTTTQSHVPRPTAAFVGASWAALFAGTLAYLVGLYPAVSHTFIAREVAGLRALGVEVHTFSVRRPGPEQMLTDADRRWASKL